MASDGSRRAVWPSFDRRGVLGVVYAVALAAMTSIGFATELPPGFTETIVASNPFPENFAQLSWAPDGTLFIGDKPGKIYAWHEHAEDDEDQNKSDGESGELHLIATLLVNASGERGVNGLAVDPDYLTNRHVWVYYTTRRPNRNRVSRFTYNGEVLVDETIVLEGPPVVQTDHNAGCLRFASDKTLFIAMGDDFQGSTTAQDPFDLRGKILHINRDGSPAADNPFLDGAGGDPRVWAMGLRNPYRIAIQPVTDNVFIADVGFTRWEEVNIGFPGANFGWAHVEGHRPPGQPYVYPVYAYNRFGQGGAIIGGDFAGPDFAPGYEGDYFFAEFVQQELHRLVLDEANSVVEVELFATDFGRATDLQFGPDGAMYYVCRSCEPASVRKISYVGGDNRVPVARASGAPLGGEAPLIVQFDGSASSDPDGEDLVYHWDLGDGTTSDEAMPSRQYPEGIYDATLTVTDEQEAADSAPPLRVVAGNTPPVATITSPTDEGRYDAGQTFEYSADATDAEDGAVPCANFTWLVQFHHNTHSHPFLGPIQGECAGSFSTPLSGERDPDQWYDVRLVVGDSGNPLGPEGRLVHDQSVQLRPNLAEMTFRTVPLADHAITLDTVPLQTPEAVIGVTGMLREVDAEPVQLGSDGHWYRWVSWSDGGARRHEFATPATDTQITAFFECVPRELEDLTLHLDGAELVLEWEVASPNCYAPGEDRFRIYAAPTAVPAFREGEFPADPAFRLAGTSGAPGFRYVPDPADSYFLVVGANRQGLDGVSGHYGEPPAAP